MNDELMHIGMPRRSGRYRWGSGKRPYQSSGGVGPRSSSDKKTKKVRIKDLSDDELRKITERITLENSYYEARAKLKKNTTKESTTKKVAKKILEEAAGVAVKNLVDSYSKYLGKKFVDDAKDEDSRKKKEKAELLEKKKKWSKSLISKIFSSNKKSTAALPSPSGSN